LTTTQYIHLKKNQLINFRAYLTAHHQEVHHMDTTVGTSWWWVVRYARNV